MPRMPRGIELDQDGVYHLRGQVAGPLGAYPLQAPENAEQLLRIIRRYVGLYFCQAAGLEIMGSHYHLPARFQAWRELDASELLRLAERFYPGEYRPYLFWGPKDWRRFHRRLFNVSELMRNIQQAFARWFNRRHRRRGPFWAGRFQSSDSEDLVETVYYVELNAVRAGLVERPEDWPYSSAWMRQRGEDGWLMPLQELLQTNDRAWAEKLYWVGLYWRGTRPSKETDALIPVEAAERMEREQFGRGCYLSRIDAFSRGGVIGSRETIQKRLEQCRQAGIYRRRRHPIPVGVGGLYALRESRSSYLRL
jgi:putative transposase